MQTIAREGILSRRDFLRRFGRPGQPLILRGALSGWPLESLSDFAWYRAHFGDVRSKVRMGSRPEREVTLAEYLRGLERGATVEECGYLAQLHIATHVPTLAHELTYPPYWWSRRLTNLFLWMGPSGTRTILHCDFQDNLIAQIVGRKRFVLFSPRSTARIVPRGQKTFGSWTAYRNFDDPIPQDPDLDFVLEAGEMLYLPPHWWHEVVSLEPSITSSLFWWTPRTLSKRLPAFLVSPQLRKRIRRRLSRIVGKA